MLPPVIEPARDQGVHTCGKSIGSTERQRVCRATYGSIRLRQAIPSPLIDKRRLVDVGRLGGGRD
jgi:hypothetical protein